MSKADTPARSAAAEKWHNGSNRYGLENIHASAHESFCAGWDAATAQMGRDLRAERERSGLLAATLEAVRSQMCWERDRDQLTMGMSDLHNSVTKALAYDKSAGGAG